MEGFGPHSRGGLFVVKIIKHMNINEEFILTLARNQQLLSIVKDFDISEELKEMVLRNQDIIDNFINNVVKIELDVLCKTYEEIDKIYKDASGLSLFESLPEGLRERFGIKVFEKYSHMMAECFNKIVTKEERTDLLINDEEIRRHDIWLERIKYTRNKEVLVNLNNLLFELMIPIHNARISELREKNEERYHNDEMLRKNERQKKEKIILLSFIKQNEKFINLFIKEVRDKENKKDSLGLSDKTVFDKEINNFLNKLSRHSGYKSIEEIEGYYFGFEDNFSNELKIMYQNN